MTLTVREHRQTAITTQVIFGLCVGLAVAEPDVWAVLSTLIAGAVTGAATYVWLMAEMDERSRR